MNNRIRTWDSLELRVPIIQGGMGIGISLSSLAGTVAAEGGIGIISAAQIGFREPDFDQNPLAANLRAMKTELAKARAIAPNGVIGFNIMKAMRHYEQYVKTAVEIGADIIVTGAGLPTELPKLVHEALKLQKKADDTRSAFENKTEECLPESNKRKNGPDSLKLSSVIKRPLLAPIISTDKAANVILKYWDKKYHQMPDLLVIEGPKAGGHLGFGEQQLNEFDDAAYETEIQKILHTVHKYEQKYDQKIITALGGGICTREDANRAFALGADLIQVASRFVTTLECDADIHFKEAYLNAGKEDIIIVKSPVGMPGRAIKNKFMERVIAGEKIPHSRCHGCLHQCSPNEIPYCITDTLIHAANGKTDEALLFCGANAYRAKKLETVKVVIDSLV